MKVLLPLALVFVLLSSGCLSLDPTTLAKATPAVSKFLEDYPNAEIKATHYTIEESASIVDDIMADCEKEVVTPKEYYKVKITDEESDLDVVAWVDVKNQLVECVVKRGSSGGSDTGEETISSYNECTDAEKAAEACTMEYNPVCAQVDTGVRCVTTPCPSTEWKTFGNSCSACAEDGVLGWKDGACGEVCQSKYKVKCGEGNVFWYDSCGNKEGKKEYCPLGCSEGACITDEKVCDVGKNYLEKPSCNCPDGYEMIVVYPRCEQVQTETQARDSGASGGGSAASDGVTGQITGMPVAQAVQTDAGMVKIAEQYTTEAAERCAGGQPLYRCVKKEECKPRAKDACYGGHMYWYDSCGNVQEKEEYCENGACVEADESQYVKECYEGHVYLVNSGGIPVKKYQYCVHGCEDGACIAEQDGEVCCESFGYGSQMVECCQSYAWTTEAGCAVSEMLVGGGKRIVDDSYCACTDSDEGYNVYEKGTAEDDSQELSDHCNDDGTLTEKFCQDGVITWNATACPDGYSCSDGACVESIQTQ